MADDGNVMKAIVFLIVFSALFSFMYAYSSAAFGSDETPNADDFISRHFSPDEIATMTFWENDTGGFIYNMTESVTVNDYVMEPPIWNDEPVCDGTRFDYYKPSSDEHVRIYPMSDDVSGEYEYSSSKYLGKSDSFLVYQQWGWWDREWESITFQRIIINLKTTDEGVKSDVHIDLKGGMNVYFLFPIGTTSDNAMAILQSGYGFNIALGQSFMDETESANNAWNALTGLLTFSIDTGFWILDYLISIPVYASIAFIAFYIIKELIP